jgi:hypothetical protein
LQRLERKGGRLAQVLREEAGRLSDKLQEIERPRERSDEY